ncbi:hypothetical protein RhiirA4_462694 [Rhizophagus irregularis]|uniref:Uncharacterized protein n=1 Tax=Rhizophagus irregularis TaxID=588596 RepID=A0A2I1GLJ6_9GLOM|nr:hypothetical protein RhiirA4_462694 [Rhizophagus irregularis]
MYAGMLIYRESYENNIAEICSKTDVAEKTVKSQVYTIYTMINASLPKVSESNLDKKTQRAGNVCKLFGKIIDPATKKEVMGSVSIKFMEFRMELNALSTSVSNSSGGKITRCRDTSGITPVYHLCLPPVNKPSLQISILPEDPEEKRKHIIRLVLERFSYLFLRESDERGGRFNLNSSVLYPMIYNRDHKEKIIGNNIKGEWVNIAENDFIVSYAGMPFIMESQ